MNQVLSQVLSRVLNQAMNQVLNQVLSRVLKGDVHGNEISLRMSFQEGRYSQGWGYLLKGDTFYKWGKNMHQQKVYTMMPIPDCSQIATSTNLAEAIRIALRRSRETNHPYGIYVDLNHLASYDGSLYDYDNDNDYDYDYGYDNDERDQNQAPKDDTLTMQSVTIAMQEAAIKGLMTQIKRLNCLACRDPLTGLYNRRYLNQRMKAEFKRASRYSEPLSCAMLDVDNFKQVNDTHGHPFGDNVLTELAIFLRHHFRETDIITRYGGDEFCIILPRTSYKDATNLMQKVNTRVNDLLIKLDEITNDIGMSHGVAAIDEQITTPVQLIEQADAALRSAKEQKKEKRNVSAVSNNVFTVSNNDFRETRRDP